MLGQRERGIFQDEMHPEDRPCSEETAGEVSLEKPRVEWKAEDRPNLGALSGKLIIKADSPKKPECAICQWTCAQPMSFIAVIPSIKPHCMALGVLPQIHCHTSPYLQTIPSGMQILWLANSKSLNSSLGLLFTSSLIFPTMSPSWLPEPI